MTQQKGTVRDPVVPSRYDAWPGSHKASDAVRLEVALLTSAQDAPRVPVLDHADPIGLTVVLADESEEIRGYATACIRQLTPSITHVIAVPDGQAAFRAAHRASPHLIIAGVMLPDMDGLTLCRTLREDPALHDTAVLLTTDSVPGYQLRTNARLAGADGLLGKPFNALMLCKEIARVLRVPVDGICF